MAVTENMLIDIAVNSKDANEKLSLLSDYVTKTMNQISTITTMMRSSSDITSDVFKTSIESIEKQTQVLEQNIKINEQRNSMLENSSRLILNNLVASSANITSDIFKQNSEAIEKQTQAIEQNIKINEQQNSMLENTSKIIKSLISSWGVAIVALASYRNNLLGISDLLSPMITNIEKVIPLNNIKKSINLFDMLNLRIQKYVISMIKTIGIELGLNPIKIIKTTANIQILNAILASLGFTLRGIDTEFTKLTGKILLITSAIFTFGSSLIALLAIKTGSAIENLGISLLKGSEKVSEAYTNFKTAYISFQESVNKSISITKDKNTQALNDWNKAIEKAYRETIFGKTEIVQSFDEIVKVSNTLGLSFDESLALANTAMDLAASKSISLAKATSTIVEALNLESDAMEVVGASYDFSQQQYEKYLETTGLVSDQISTLTKQQLVFNTILTQNKDIVGAASKQNNTLEGSWIQLTKQIENAKIKIGESTIIYRALKAIYDSLINSLKSFAIAIYQSIPKQLIEAITTLFRIAGDLSGIILILIGFTIKWTVIIGTLWASIKTLNLILFRFLGIQIAISGVFSTLILTIMPLIGAFLAFGAAWNSLYDDSEAFRKVISSIFPIWETTSSWVKEITLDFSWLSKILKVILDGFVNLAKFLITSFVQAILLVQLSIINLKKLFTSDETDLQAYEMMLTQISGQLIQINKLSQQSLASLPNIFGSDIAFAPELSKLPKEIEKSVDLSKRLKSQSAQFVADMIKAAKVINKEFDPKYLRTSVLGTDFEKIISEYDEIKTKINEVYKLKLDRDASAKEVADLQIKQLEKEYQIERMRIDVLKDVSKQYQNIKTDILKAQGRNIAALKIERDEQLKSLDDQISGLKLLGGMRDEDLQKLQSTRKLLVQSYDLKIANERNQYLNKAIEAEKLLAEINKESSRVEEDAIKNLRDRVEVRKLEIEEMRRSLIAANNYGARAKAALDEAARAAENIFPAGLAKLQKEEIDKVLQTNIELQKTITENGMTQYEQTQAAYKVQKEALAKEYQRLQMTGLLYDAEGNINERLWEQLSIQEDLIAKQREGALVKQPSKEFQRLEQIGNNAANTIGNTFKTGALSMVGGSMSIVSAIVAAISALLDFIPQFFQAIADLANKIVDFPQTLTNAIMNLNKGLLRLFTDFIPNVAKFIPKLIDDTLENAANRIPDALEKILDNLPDYAQKIIDRIPDWIEKLIQSLINNAPRLVMATAKLWMIVLPKIYASVFTMIIRDLPQAIVNGIKKGLKDLTNLNQFINFKIPSVQEIGDQLSLAWKASTKTLTGEASKLFSVMDLNQAAGAQDMATKISKAIENGHISGSRWWTEKWNAAMAKLKELWNWIMKQATALWDGIVAKWRQLWDGIVALLTAVWNTLNEIWTIVINALTSLWTSLQEIWSTVTNTLTALWTSLQTIWDKVLNTLGGLWTSLQSIWTAITSSLTNFTSSISDVFTKSTSALMSVGEFFSRGLESFVTALKSVIDAMTSLLSFLKDIGTSIVSGLKRGLDGLVDTFASFGASISGSFTSGISSIGTKFSEFGSKIFSSFTYGLDSLGDKFSGFGAQIFNSLKSGLDGLGKFFTDMLNNLNPGSLLEKIFRIDSKGQGTVERTLGIDVPGVNFARGGVVPGAAMVAGDSKLNDRIVALLSPGEAIIPRSLMQNEMIKNLVGSILSGKLAPPAYAYGGIKVSAKGGISIGGTQIPGTALPTIPTSVDQAKAEIVQQITAPLAPVVDLWQQVRDQVMKMVWGLFENAKFHQGGLVPAFAGGGDVPAFLTPGEFVLNPSAVRNIGLSNLNAMNNGKQTPGVTNQTINVNIEITPTQLDDNYVRTKLMPRMKDEIRRASLDGSFVVSGKGIRR